MGKPPMPPEAFNGFVKRFPDLEVAWQKTAEVGREGPLDENTARLAKLAIAIGALREGAVHASVRKAAAQGISSEAIEQVVALAAGTIGLPATVAAYTWVRDELDSDST